MARSRPLAGPGLPWHESFALGALMNTRGLMELIALNVGYDLGILTPKVFTMMVLMALADDGDDRSLAVFGAATARAAGRVTLGLNTPQQARERQCRSGGHSID